MIVMCLVLGIVCGFILYQIARQKKSYKDVRDERVFKLTPSDGHKIYELNCETFDMSEIEAQEYQTDEGKFKRIVVDDKCLYCTALNEKNAIKKFNKMVPGTLTK